MFVLMPVKLLTNTAHQRILLQCLEIAVGVVLQHIDIADDSVRPAGAIGRRLHPGDLILEARGRPVGLDVDRLLYASGS